MADRNKAVFISVLLTIVVIALYSPVRNFEFLNIDDDKYISKNPYIREGLTLHGLKFAFTADLTKSTQHSDYWHPVTFISHMIDIELFRLEPGGPHLMNVFIHVANVLLVFFLLLKTTNSLYKAAFVSAFFGLHPLQTESVAWIVERKDVLSTFFWLLTLCVYTRYSKKPSKSLYAGVTGLFTLGLMSKTAVITAPLTFLLFDFWPLNRLDFKILDRVKLRQCLLEKIPWCCLSVLSAVITLHADTINAMKQPFATTLSSVVVTYVIYLKKILWPSVLSIYYPPFNYPLAVWQWIGAGIFLGLTTAIMVKRRKTVPAFLIGWLWFLGTLIPVVGLTDIGTADRFTYVPMIGIGIVLAWGFPAVLDSTVKLKNARLLHIVALLFLLALSARTFAYIPYWEDGQTIFRQTLAVTGKSWNTHINLGQAYLAKKEFQRALKEYREALRFRPSHVPTLYNYGRTLSALDRSEEGKKYYRRALSVDPEYVPALNNLAAEHLKTGRIKKAIKLLKHATQLQPEYAPAYFNLGNALVFEGRIDDAAFSFKRGLELDPFIADAQKKYGLLLAKKGIMDGAEHHTRKAIQLSPNMVDAHINLGNILGMQGKVDDAAHSFEKAVKLEPSNASAVKNLATARKIQKRYQEAINGYKLALEIDTQWVEVKSLLAWIYATCPDPRLRDKAESLRLAQEACKATNFQKPEALDSLSAAYAANGQFKKAIDTVENGIEILKKKGNKKLADILVNHLNDYEQNRAFIEGS